MKKLLGIVVLGLLLISCDQNQDKNKSEYKPDFLRAIENCADYKFEPGRQEQVQRWRRALINKTYQIKYMKVKIKYWETIHKKPLSKKMKNVDYPIWFKQCEFQFTLDPKKFKEKWL